MLAFHPKHIGELCGIVLNKLTFLSQNEKTELFLALIPCSLARNSQLYRPILNLFRESPTSGLCIPVSLNFLRQSYCWKKYAIQTYISICVTTSSKIQVKSGDVFTVWDVNHVPSLCPDHWTLSSALRKLRKSIVPPHPSLCCILMVVALPWGEKCEFWIPSGRPRNCTKISLIMRDFYRKMRGGMPLGCSLTVLKKDRSVLSCRI